MSFKDSDIDNETEIETDMEEYERLSKERRVLYYDENIDSELIEKINFKLYTKKEERFKYGKIGGDKCYENKSGIHSLSKEMRVKYCRMGGLIGGKKGGKLTGKENAKKLNSQVWECTITGHRSNPGGLSKYQRARGIDTTKRVRIS